jgi:hypothetical protein
MDKKRMGGMRCATMQGSCKGEKGYGKGGMGEWAKEMSTGIMVYSPLKTNVQLKFSSGEAIHFLVF